MNNHLNINLKDIFLFFSSSCCNKTIESSEISDFPCQNSHEMAYISSLPAGISAHAGTITIGNKYYGKMSYLEQYRHMVRAIKRTYPFRGITKYTAHFELTKNGQLHSHLLIIDGYQKVFSEGFDAFGPRNNHKQSYQECKNIIKYLEYINKENILKPITNFPKSKAGKTNPILADKPANLTCSGLAVDGSEESFPPSLAHIDQAITDAFSEYLNEI
ncbi:MAG: putative replicase [Circoviridae sp.]|nr:MAG: putative replicase [Circoviridae sp.]